MLDIKFIRENKDLIKEGAKKKHIDFDVDKLVSIDADRRELLTSIETRKAEQNQVGQSITIEQDETKKAELIEKMRMLKESIKTDEEKLSEIMKEWQLLMVSVPNIPDISVPDGLSDEDNVEVKTWGEAKDLGFD